MWWVLFGWLIITAWLYTSPFSTLQISSPNAGEGAHGLNTHLQLLKSYYNPVQNSWDANAIAIVEIMHLPYFFHGEVSTSWLRVFFMTINITWGRGGRRGNKLLLSVHSQAFMLGEEDYELALSVSSCDHSLKTTHLYYRHLSSFPKFEISLNP